jgi:hypothetical protein
MWDRVGNTGLRTKSEGGKKSGKNFDLFHLFSCHSSYLTQIIILLRCTTSGCAAIDPIQQKLLKKIEIY